MFDITSGSSDNNGVLKGGSVGKTQRSTTQPPTIAYGHLFIGMYVSFQFNLLQLNIQHPKKYSDIVLVTACINIPCSE